MARLFMVSVSYDGITHWATVVNYPATPLTFEVKFFKEFGPSDLPRIILELKDGKFQLASGSGTINDELVTAIAEAVENHAIEKSIK